MEEFLPLLHLGSDPLTQEPTLAFRGTFDYTLDAKNRLAVPPKFRSQLADGVVLAMRHDASAIALWRPEDYEEYTRQALADYRPLSPEAASLRRFFFGNSHDAELDSAGRVMVPPFLLEHAGLKREVVVTGAGDCLEVWDRGAWAQHNATLARRVADITAQLGHPA